MIMMIYVDGLMDVGVELQVVDHGAQGCWLGGLSLARGNTQMCMGSVPTSPLGFVPCLRRSPGHSSFPH